MVTSTNDWYSLEWSMIMTVVELESTPYQIGLFVWRVYHVFSKSARIWWSGHFMMKWPFLDDMVVSGWSGCFLMKFPIYQKRGTSSSSTWFNVENVPEKMNSSKKGNFIKKCRFFDEVAVSWWCGRFLMKWAFLGEVDVSWWSSPYR